MDHLKQLFAQATEHCQQFAEMLEQEQQALLTQDISALQALLDAKTPLIERLAADEQLITTHCRDAGRLADDSLTDYVRSLNDAALVDSHAVFVAALEQCQNANLRNGRLVRHSQHSNSHLLDLLRNQGETSLNIYDRQGQASRPAPQRPLSKA